MGTETEWMTDMTRDGGDGAEVRYGTGTASGSRAADGDGDVGMSSRDRANDGEVDAKKKRDGREKMRRWKCRSNLRLVLDLEQGNMHISFKHHKAHATYDWRTCSQGYRDHIRANLHRTPVDIANDLREQFRLGNNVAFGPPPDTQVVGFWWREYNNTRWEVDPGSTVQESVEKILGKVKGVVQMEMESLSEGGVVDTIAWICEGMIEKIGITNIMEVALGGTRTNFSMFGIILLV